jgi:hypothetical protein
MYDNFSERVSKDVSSPEDSLSIEAIWLNPSPVSAAYECHLSEGRVTPQPLFCQQESWLSQER